MQECAVLTVRFVADRTCGAISWSLTNQSIIVAVLIHARRRNLGNEARPTFEGDVVPQPVHSHNKTIAKADEKVNVQGTPEQPTKKTLQLNGSEFDHGGAPSDCGQGTLVSVSERWQRPAGDTCCNQLTDIVTHLLGCRREAGNRSPISVLHSGRIADHEDVVVCG